jgi:hypothetical protein
MDPWKEQRHYHNTPHEPFVVQSKPPKRNCIKQILFKANGNVEDSDRAPPRNILLNYIDQNNVKLRDIVIVRFEVEKTSDHNYQEALKVFIG